MKREHAYQLLIWTIRLLVAGVFIFSGFVKAVDPWGTAIKLSEYFQAFGMAWLAGISMICSVALAAGEMLLGFALLFRLREPLSALGVLLVLFFFTALTFVLALWNPVEDCGCFGDAIKLTNWETFYKNLILLPLAFVLWRVARRSNRSGEESLLVESSMLFLFTLFGIGVGIYSLQHLPLIDFLPYRVGVHIPSEMQVPDGGEVKTTLIYRDKLNGNTQEFTLSDTTWYDTTRWEFVDTRILEEQPIAVPKIKDFAIFDTQEEITEALLTDPKELFIVTLTRTENLSDDCRTRLRGLAQYASRNGLKLLCVTTSPLDQMQRLSLGDSLSIPLYNMDGTALKTLIRTKAGVILLKEGTILAKWSCRDLPDFAQQTNPQPLSMVLSDRESHRVWSMVGVMVALFTLIYLTYIWHKRK